MLWTGAHAGLQSPSTLVGLPPSPGHSPSLAKATSPQAPPLPSRAQRPLDQRPRSRPRCALSLAACRPTALAATHPPSFLSYTQTRQSHWATHRGLTAKPEVPVASEAALNSENFPQNARSCPPSTKQCFTENTHHQSLAQQATNTPPTPCPFAPKVTLETTVCCGVIPTPGHPGSCPQ